MANATDPLANSASTTEGRLSIFGAVAGVVIAIVGGLAPLLTDAAQRNPGTLWIQLASLVCGGALSAWNTSSLNKSRADTKGSILELLQNGSAAITPLIAGAVLKKYLSPTVTSQMLSVPRSERPTPVDTPRVP